MNNNEIVIGEYMVKRLSFHRKDNNKRPPSLYGKETNERPSLYRRDTRNTRSGQSGINFKRILAAVFMWMRRNPRIMRNVCLIAVVVLAVFLVATHIPLGNDDACETSSKIALIGNNSLGSVYKEGPFGNDQSNVSVAYILGVHPRENGAHRLMEEAFRKKADSLNCTYYLYKINVTSNPTDYEQSRLNGQLLAREFAIPDIINCNLTAAVDVHYSNGNWGVPRFVFTPNENNSLSAQLGHALADNFQWLEYYTPPDPTSPEYVTEPLNEGGVGAIIYEAYTEDDNNVTLDHDRQIVDFVDDWAFTKLSGPEEKGFFLF